MKIIKNYVINKCKCNLLTNKRLKVNPNPNLNPSISIWHAN